MRAITITSGIFQFHHRPKELFQGKKCSVSTVLAKRWKNANCICLKLSNHVAVQYLHLFTASWPRSSFSYSYCRTNAKFIKLIKKL